MSDKQISVVQANHGFFVLQPVFDKPYGTVDTFEKSPVIAWVVTINFTPNGEPIAYPNALTLNGLADSSPIMRPDGVIEFPDEVIFEGEKAWNDALVYINQEQLKKRFAPINF